MKLLGVTSMEDSGIYPGFPYIYILPNGPEQRVSNDL
jgi:hypothetical protein